MSESVRGKLKKDLIMAKSRSTLIDGMHLKNELDGFKIDIDADVEFGGRNLGVKPKDLVLSALTGCTALDVISIMRKMKNMSEVFYVEAEAEESESQPKVFTKIMLTYYFKGGGVREENARKAIDLSLTKYCSVAAMLRGSVPIEYSLVIE